MGLNIEHVLKFSTEQGYIDQLAINCVTYCHSGYSAAKSGLRHLYCLAWVLLQEIGCHTGACGAANCPKTAWKRGASCRICALFLQTSLLLLGDPLNFSLLKIWWTLGIGCRFPVGVLLLPSDGFQVNAIYWILLVLCLCLLSLWFWDPLGWLHLLCVLPPLCLPTSNRHEVLVSLKLLLDVLIASQA